MTWKLAIEQRLRIAVAIALMSLTLLAGHAPKAAFAGAAGTAGSGQAESIDAFIHEHYDRLEFGLAQFEHYVEMVRTQQEIPESVFLDGRSILLIVDGGWQRLMAEYVASHRGKPFSEQDRVHFQRTVAVREQQAGAVYDAVFERIQASGAGGLVSGLNLLAWFIGGLEMRQYLDDLPDELLRECAGQIRAAMLDFDRAELWHALLNGRGEPLQHYRDHGPLPTLEYLTTRQIQPVVQGHFHGPLEPVGRSLVAAALGQAFAMDLYDLEYAALKFSGFNDLMGTERALRLHTRAMQAVQAAERAADDDLG